MRTEKAISRPCLIFFRSRELRLLLLRQVVAVSRPHSQNLRSEDKDVLFVDIGTSSLGIHICREGHLAVTRNIAYGLNDIIRDLSRQFNISDEEAETAVREYGVSQTILDIKDKVAVAEEIMRQKYEAGNADDKNKINFWS